MEPMSCPVSKSRPRGSLVERFWPKVSCGDGCWLWLGGKTKTGYGVIQGGGRGSKLLLAHRVSYELHFGAVESGRVVMHTCDNRACVNPAHLMVGSQSDNIKDAFSKGRMKSPAKSGESNGKSKLTAERVAYIKNHPEMKHTELATMFGLSPNCIRGVRIGRTWN